MVEKKAGSAVPSPLSIAQQTELHKLYAARWESRVKRFEQIRDAALGHTVSFIQMYLKSMLVLNGGGIIAIPTFAEAVGSMWATGQLLPLAAISFFVLGVITASAATFGYGRAYVRWQNRFNEGAMRASREVWEEYEAALAGNTLQMSDPLVMSDIEDAAYKEATIRQKIALCLSFCSLVMFLFGAVAGVYVIAGTFAQSQAPDPSSMNVT
jgi:hypothetical protein